MTLLLDHKGKNVLGICALALGCYKIALIRVVKNDALGKSIWSTVASQKVNASTFISTLKPKLLPLVLMEKFFKSVM